MVVSRRAGIEDQIQAVINIKKVATAMMKSVKPQVLYVTAIIVIFSLLLWIAALFFVYLADDWSSPAADERSVPAPMTY